jgi:thiamine-phosphate pyrophosphorylase
MMRCLVTDRRRLCGGDVPFETARRRLTGQVAAAVEAGVELVLVREPDLDARHLARLVRDLVAVRRATATRLVVNDRLDVALAEGADGVHLRGDSFAASAVRRIVPPGFVVGRSVHTVAEARAAGPVDYLVAGTVFPTVSKPAAVAWLGVEGLSSIARAVSAPVLAIGGMTAAHLADVQAAGAAGVAAIGLFIDRFDRPGPHL